MPSPMSLDEVVSRVSPAEFESAVDRARTLLERLKLWLQKNSHDADPIAAAHVRLIENYLTNPFDQEPDPLLALLDSRATAAAAEIEAESALAVAREQVERASSALCGLVGSLEPRRSHAVA
ncbi:MAG: hypothetical protein NXI31_10760 [bacterium]|nr:hypothetical protein [bacterium]